MNKKNLIPLDKRPQRERKEIARKGAIACNKKKAERKALKELLILALDEGDVDADGKFISKKMAGAVALADQYASGDIKAIEVASKIIGEWQEKPEVVFNPVTLVVNDDTAEKLKTIAQKASK